MADPKADSGKRNVANAWWSSSDLGKSWKVNPFIVVEPGETFTIGEIDGSGSHSTYLDDSYRQLEVFNS
jgi:hypothetical protein